MSDVESKQRVGVAFTGNGLRGLANIALIEFFEEINYKPDLIIGCGSGAIIAGMWGLGQNSVEITEFVTQNITRNLLKKVDPYGFLFFLKSPFGPYKIEHAILKSSPIKNLFKQIFNQTKLEELQQRILIQTTNVETGKGAVFDKGVLADLVYASGATIPFLPPININNQWYADGNFSSPVPAMELVNRNMKNIISLTFTGHSAARPRSFLSFYSNFVNLAFSKSQRNQIALAIELHDGEILLLPVKTHLIEGLVSSKEIQRLIEAGRATVASHRDALLRMIE